MSRPSQIPEFISRRLSLSPATLSVYVVATASFAWFLILKLGQHFSFHTGAYDLSLYSDLLTQSAEGRLFFSPLLGRNYLGEHASLVLGLFIPLTTVGDPRVGLLALQALVVSTAAIPLYFAARRETDLPWLAALLAALFLVNPIVARGLAYDFHPEMLWPLCCFALYLAALGNRKYLFWILLSLCLSIKEDCGLYLIGFGLYLAWTGRRRLGVTTAIISFVWSVVAFVVIVPSFNPDTGSSPFLAQRWSHLGATYGDIVASLLLNPSVVLGGIFVRPFRRLLETLIYAPLLDVRLFLALPPLLMNTLPAFDLQNGLQLYYGITVVPFVFMAAIGGGRRIWEWTGRRPWIALVLSIVVLSQNRPNWILHWPSPEELAMRQTLATLPADSKVSAQNSIVPHLPRLAQVSVFPKGASEADLIVLDRARTPWPLSEPEFAAVINGLKGSRAYYPLVDDGRFLLLSRKGLTTPLVAPIT